MSLLELVVLTFAVYRAVRFLVFDSLMGFNLASNSRLSRRVDVWAYTPEGDDRGFIRGKVGDLLTCPFCLGFHVTWVVYCVVVMAWPWDLGVQGWLEVWAVAGGAMILHAWGPPPPAST